MTEIFIFIQGSKADLEERGSATKHNQKKAAAMIVGGKAAVQQQCDFLYHNHLIWFFYQENF